jgi:hypothetical protein
MITEEAFLKIFEKTGLSVIKLKLLYWSMAKSIVMFLMGENQSLVARKKEDKYQQYVIGKMNFSKVTDKGKLLEKMKRREHEISKEAKEKKHSSHIIFEFILEYRLAIYADVLEFRLQDSENLDLIKENLEKLRKSEKNHKLWKIGITTATATVALKLLFPLIFGRKDEERK